MEAEISRQDAALVRWPFRKAVLLLMAGLMLGITGLASASSTIKVDLTAARWHSLPADSMGPQGDAQFLQKEGFPQGLLVLKAGSEALDGLTFQNGTIEYDFKPLAADMPGLQFRVSGPAAAPDGEEVYFRVFGDERASDDGMQYVPLIHGFMPWNLYPQYQHQAPLVNGWNHVKLVVTAHRLRVYVNHLPEPVLSVDHLESDSRQGSLRVRGPAIFANLEITPGVVDGLPSAGGPDAAAGDRGLVRQWRISPLQPLRAGFTPAYADMPVRPSAWRTVASDRGGLLNLNRQYQISQDPPAIEWLLFTVKAGRSGAKRVSLGWIGQVWIFVNGQAVTQGKNFYYPETERRNPDGRLSYANGSFDLPLRSGTNEVALALYSATHDDLSRRTKYGWGAMLRFNDASGLRLPQP